MWEAAEHAAFYELDNLTAIVDVNRLGQRGETMHGWDLAAVLRPSAPSAGMRSRSTATTSSRSTPRTARPSPRPASRPRSSPETIKGKGVLEGRGPGRLARQALRAEEAIEELGGIRNITVDVPKPDPAERHRFDAPGSPGWPRYEVGSKVATRKAYGEALAALGGADPMVVALDGEVSNSTYAEIFRDAYPDGSSRCTSRSSRWSPRPSGSRCSDGSRSPPRSPPSEPRLRLRPHGRDQPGDPEALRFARRGLDRRRRPSQMALEDLASSARSTAPPSSIRPTAIRRRKLVRAMADLEGISFLGRPGRHAGALRAGRGLPDRRQQDGALDGRRRRHDRRPPGSRSTRRWRPLRPPRQERILRPGHRPLLGQADRRRDTPVRSPDPDRDRRRPLGGRRARGSGAGGTRRRRGPASGQRSLAVRELRTRASRPSSWPQPGSTPRRSPRLHEPSSRAPASA